MVTPGRHIEAMEKVNDLIGVRERNCKEVRERLLRAGFNEEEVQDAIETSLRVGLISHERYARAYIRGKSRLGWGRGKILSRLKADGIEDDVIASVSCEFRDDDAELQSALRELSKRKSTAKDLYGSYMRRLVGKGYDYDVARRAVSQHLGQA